MNNRELENYFDILLNAKKIKDYAPNGLQIEGRLEIKKLIFGVTASQDLIDYAITHQADGIVVHHGYFWKGEAQQIIGMKYRRIKALIKNDINLYAYHLPLDIHQTLGNNAQLAKVLDIGAAKPISDDGLLWAGRIQNQTADEFKHKLSTQLNRDPLLIEGGSHSIYNIAWCSGAAQDYISSAYEYRMDAFFSGEISERTFHEAKELGIHYYSAGHHATEVWGVKALLSQLAKDFPEIKSEFVDFVNPV